MNPKKQQRLLNAVADDTELLEYSKRILANCAECKHCNCCQYVLFPVPPNDYSYLTYLILHGITILIDTRLRIISAKIQTKCTKQLADGKCGIYDSRPHICREHAEVVCVERDDEIRQGIFRNVQTEGDLEKAHELIKLIWTEQVDG